MDFYWHHEDNGPSQVIYVAPGQQVKADGRKVLPLDEHPAIIEKKIIDTLDLPRESKTKKRVVGEKTMAVFHCLRSGGAMSVQQVSDAVGIAEKLAGEILSGYKDLFVKSDQILNPATKRYYNIYDLTPEAKQENFAASFSKTRIKRTKGQLLETITNVLLERGPMPIIAIAEIVGTQSGNIYNTLTRNCLKFERLNDKRWRLIKHD